MRLLPLLVLVGCSTVPAAEDGFIPLFNGKDLSGWVPVNVAPGTFTVRDGMIICDGKPTGVMRTERHYENFIVEFEWRHTVLQGNAGFFIWSDPLPAVGAPFTRSIEVQVLDGHDAPTHTSHGDIFPIWGATLKPDNNRGRGDRAFPTEMRANPSPHWNHYRIECRDGHVSLAVNGKVVTTAREASPRKGYLCIESEGGVVHYRNMRIKELPPSNSPLPPEHIAKLDEGFSSLYTGVDLTGWRATETAARHWKLADWTLRYDGQGAATERILLTERRFDDCELFLDFRDEMGWGIILLPRGESVRPIVIHPESPGMRKPGEWNRLRLQRIGDVISLELNGELLPAQIVSTPKGPAALGLSAMGPVTFANIFIRRLTDAD